MKDLKADKLRYQPNSLGYALVLFALAAGVVGLFTVITYDAFGIDGDATRVVPDFRIGLEIAWSIVMMLLTFLAAEKVKAYDPAWSSLGLIVLASATLLRVADFGERYRGIALYCFDERWIPLSVLNAATIWFAGSGLLLSAAAIVSIRRVVRLRMHLKEVARHGNAHA